MVAPGAAWSLRPRGTLPKQPRGVPDRAFAGATSMRWCTNSLAPGVYFAVLRLDGVVEKRLRVVVIE